MLDGLRGLMALWVFFGHVELWCIGKLAPWGSPAIAVDIFMLLSGFLMAFHWEIRKKRFATVREQSIDFYIRRFFRIAPLYYVLLILAYVGQSHYMQIEEYLKSIAPPPWADSTMTKTASYAIDLPNVLSHVTFLFGLIPKFASNTILPDWSIGLEMQFYMLFPLLILALARFGAFSVSAISLVAVIVTSNLIGLYLHPGILGNFPQPSMILFKLNIFAAGMCLALFYLNRGTKECIYYLIPAAVSLILSAPQVQASAMFMAFMLYFNSQRSETLYAIISGRVARFLGDTSYSVYLLHKLIMLPGLYVLFHWQWFMARGASVRVVIAFCLLAIPIYSCAYMLFRLVELPGIQLARTILRRRRVPQPKPAAVAAAS